MAKKKYTAAIIGTGRIGFTLGFDKKREQPASHTMALKANRRVRILAGCDTSASRLKQWEKFNKKAALFSDSAHLFAAIKPDIVVIAVNEDSHLSSSLAALRAKPRLLILEKPVALNMEEGRRIQAEAFSQNVPVLVNHERRFSLDYRIARDYMKGIGSIQTVNARLDSGLYVYNPEKEESGEYSLLHDGTHLVDIVQFLLEGLAEKTDAYVSEAKPSSGAGSVSDAEISEERASSESDAFSSGAATLSKGSITSIYYDEKNTDIVRNLTVHFESPVCNDVNFFFSGRSRFFGFEVEVIGTEGAFRIGNGIFEFYKREESRLYSGFYSLTADKKVKRPKKTLYFSNMVKNAVDFLDGKEPLYSSLETGLKTLEILEDIKNKIRSQL
ncbi:MAG: Gfo/Idh/MocA family oxidoreductase [Treponema sp.]|nr:Gfo/Idh/MocA family oxidoreductase [Treponema sp.]